jgi:hypothetical protein
VIARFCSSSPPIKFTVPLGRSELNLLSGPGGKVAGPHGEKERGGERPPDWAMQKRKEGRLGWAAREKWERKKKKESGLGPTRK